MKPEVRKRLRQYGIPIDLAILATGVGLLFSTIPASGLLFTYLVTVALSAWKLGWKSGIVAMIAGLLAMTFGFGETMTGAHTVTFAALSLVVTGIANAVRPSRPSSARTDADAGAVAGEVADADEIAVLQLERQELAADASRAEAARIVAERETEERAAEARAAFEREEAQRAEAARVEAERVALIAPPVERTEPPPVERTEPSARKPSKRAREREERHARERAAAERLELETKELARKLDEERQALERAAAERAVAAERLEREKADLARRLEEERQATERAAAERLAAERQERERVEREREELARKLDEERQALERAATQRAEQTRLEAEREERERVEREKEALARKIEEERQALERAAVERAQQERLAAERAAEERHAAERQQRERLEREKEELTRQLAGGDTSATQLASEREAREKLEQEKQELAKQLAQARESSERDVEERLAAERGEMQRKFDEQLRAERAAMEETKTKPAVAPPPPEPERGLFSKVASWLKSPKQSRHVVNLQTKKVATNAPPRRSVLPAPPPTRTTARPVQTQNRERRPRVLMLERRRGMADTVAPRLRDVGLEVQIVERLVDAVDEVFRFRPDAIFLDVELPDFTKAYKSITDQAPKLPLFLTSASHSSLPTNVPRAASVIRPYSADGIAKLARDVVANPQTFLERQKRPAAAPAAAVPSSPGSPPQRKTPIAAVEPLVQGPIPLVPTPPAEAGEYEVVCFNCRVAFDATDADWCSCLTKERTLVCTNCLTCFCKAPPAYKEKFWVEAPPRLFERKTAELRKTQVSVGANPRTEDVKRPLVMLVEDDEDIQTIVQRVCSNLGYGFVTANNGQDGLTLARLYRPNMILSDAFMPKLDGREMCRILKEEAIIPECKMIVMTGLYTDTKYKSEALKRFHIDDYLSKPVSITDLINLLQKHLEGVAGGEPQEDLHELHRQQIDDEPAEEAAAADDDRTIPLADLLEQQAAQPTVRLAAPEQRSDAALNYEICCYTCGELFDATKAEWCTCLGRDQTLVCPNCNNCFCKSPAAYKERFWMDAPSTLFERKMIGSKRNVSGKINPSPMEVKRPLILLVEDDENIQLIVKTVVTTMGYGFIVAANGQEGLALAREYNPDLILSDAFMPKLDGREMCRLLKEDPATSRVKAIIMTGLYTDRKYRNEALSYFKVDDYVAKPVAVDDLIKLMKKHLPQDVQPTM